jgi:hypothetical protein
LNFNNNFLNLKNWHFNPKFKILKKLTEKLYFNFENSYLNNSKKIFEFETSYLNLKIDISVVSEIIWNWKKIFEYEIFNLNSKKLFDLKFDIWILNYYFWSKN